MAVARCSPQHLSPYLCCLPPSPNTPSRSYRCSLPAPTPTERSANHPRPSEKLRAWPPPCPPPSPPCGPRHQALRSARHGHAPLGRTWPLAACALATFHQGCSPAFHGKRHNTSGRAALRHGPLQGCGSRATIPHGERQLPVLRTQLRPRHPLSAPSSAMAPCRAACSSCGPLSPRETAAAATSHAHPKAGPAPCPPPRTWRPAAGAPPSCYRAWAPGPAGRRRSARVGDGGWGGEATK